MRELRNGRYYETIYGVETSTPEVPKKKDIAGWDLPQKEQKFTTTKLPRNFARLPEAEQAAFITQEWQRRLHGYWLFINGEATWLPGGYYFELNYWHIDIGLKEYRDRDRRKWLFWDACVKSPACFGCLYMKHRRDGATYWAGCILYETISRSKDAQGGIQSKTGPDAGKVFSKAVIKPFRKLPFFFVPIFDGSEVPKKVLPFSEPPSKITKNNTEMTASAALNSSIDWRAAVDTAYDGEKLRLMFMDEQGKNVEFNFVEGWQIVKECLSLGNGTVIVGKAVITSTVAEGTKKGGNNFHEVWKQSNPREVDAVGQTNSGLWRLFLPASDGLEGFIGAFGESIQHAPTPAQLAFLRKKNPAFPYQEGMGAHEFILMKRQALMAAERWERVAEHRRLYPLSELDAFTPPPNVCIFDAQKLDQRFDELQTHPESFYETGNFAPSADGDFDSPVKWVPDAVNGHWKRCWDFPNPEADANKIRRKGDLRLPGRPEFGKLGVDPVDLDTPTDASKASQYCGGLFRRFDANDPKNSNKFIALYLHRAGKVEDSHDQMLLAARYYGVEIAYENSKPGIKHRIKSLGWRSYLGKRPEHTHTRNTRGQKEEGTPASRMINEQIAQTWKTYVYDFCHLIDFLDIIDQLKRFTLDDTREFDAVMGPGHGLVAALDLRAPQVRERATQVSPAATSLAAGLRARGRDVRSHRYSGR